MTPAARSSRRCLNCKYDLTGTLAANKRVCPECGWTFTLSQLAQGVRDTDWSIGSGLRKAAIVLLIRSLIALPLWTGFVWLLTPVVNSFPLGITTLGGVSLIFIVPGIAIGHALSRGINDIAGVQSIVVTVLVFVFLIAVIAGGVELVQILRPMPIWSGYVAMTATGFAGLWIVRNNHFAD